MKISKELLEKAEQCKTAEELVALAKENGYTLSLEKADELLKANSKKPLTEAEIDAVVGGSGPEDHIYEIVEEEDEK